MNGIKKDINLREAIGRREQKMLPMPDDLNRRVMDELMASPNRRLPLWLSVAAALVAVVALFTWKSYSPNTSSEVTKNTTENVAQENDTRSYSNKDTCLLPSGHVLMTIDTRPYDDKNASRLEKPRVAKKKRKAKKNPSTAPEPMNTAIEPSHEEDMSLADAKMHRGASAPRRKFYVTNDQNVYIIEASDMPEMQPKPTMEELREKGQRLTREVRQNIHQASIQF